MPRPDAISLDPTALIYQYHERLYRLALLLTNDAAGAAKLVERAFRELSPGGDAEPQLIRALLRRAPRPRRWQHAGGSPGTAGVLGAAGAAALADTLAGMPARARLAVGLHYLRGQSAAEIERIVSTPEARAGRALRLATRQRAGRGMRGDESIDDILTAFRVGFARALRLVPDEIDDQALLQIDRSLDGLLADNALVALRRAVFEQPAMRAARDGIAEARDLLARGIPALFASAPPQALTQRLLKLAERRQRTEVWSGMGWARAGLALGVLALAAAIVLVPSWLGRPAAPARQPAPTAAELIDSAIHRFDRAPLQAGVLHEQYRVADLGTGAYQIERWYDFAAPHRLRIAVRSERADGSAGPTLMEISTDGRSLVQYRYGDGGGSSGARPVDARVSQAEAQAALALLRSEPTASYFSRGRGGRVDVAPLYLTQARANGATFLGQTQALDRPAFLLAYRTDRLPSVSPRRPAPDQPSQVILTIDAQSHALVGISAVADGAAESSALQPLRAQVFEVLPSVPDAFWRLPTTSLVEQRDGLPSPRAPEISSARVIDLDDALLRAQGAILAPQELPSADMRGLVLPVDAGNAAGVQLLYEGEFQSVLLSPLEQRFFGEQSEGAEQSAGAFRYRVVQFNGRQAALTAAVAFRPETPDQQVLVMLVDEYATTTEREAALGRIIGSLTQVTAENLPELRRAFYGSQMAGGQG